MCENFMSPGAILKNLTFSFLHHYNRKIIKISEKRTFTYGTNSAISADRLSFGVSYIVVKIGALLLPEKGETKNVIVKSTHSSLRSESKNV